MSLIILTSIFKYRFSSLSKSLKFSMSFFGQDFIVSCYRIVMRLNLNKQMKKIIERVLKNEPLRLDCSHTKKPPLALRFQPLMELKIINKRISSLEIETEDDAQSIHNNDRDGEMERCTLRSSSLTEHLQKL